MEISYVISKKKPVYYSKRASWKYPLLRKKCFSAIKSIWFKEIISSIGWVATTFNEFLKQFLLLRTQLKQIMKFVVLGLQHEIETIVCKSLRVAQGLSRLWKQGWA